MVYNGTGLQRKIKNATIHEAASLPAATQFAGFNLLSDYVTAKGIDTALATAFGDTKAPWATHGLPLALRTILDGCLLGIERIWHFDEIEREPLLCQKRGVIELPDVTTLYRDIERFSDPGHLARLKGIGRRITDDELQRLPRGVLELDSTVMPLYGMQEGAHIGYNSQKRGRPSHHPLICRERLSGLVIDSQLRPGDTSSTTDAAAFLDEILVRRPRWRRWFARADRGYDCDEIMVTFEVNGVHHVIKARVTPDLARALWDLPAAAWRTVAVDGPIAEVQVATLRFRRKAWSRERRVVAIRRRDPEQPASWLWDELGYNYAAFVTDLPWDEEDIVAFYDKRADIEKTIAELKEDFSIGAACSRRFGANAALLELRCLAHNLLVLYQRDVLGLAKRHEAKSIRRWFIRIAGVLVYHSRRWLLRLATDNRLAPNLSFYRKRLAAFA